MTLNHRVQLALQWTPLHDQEFSYAHYCAEQKRNLRHDLCYQELGSLAGEEKENT